MRELNKGFTLIELLIVIAVLGILAVAVLAAINPIEQINRSRDTGSKSDAEQLIGAIDRFYASRGYYPWQTGAGAGGGTTAIDPTVVVDMSWVDSSSNPVLNKLSQAGTEEVKLSFINRITAAGYNQLYAYNRGNPGDSYYICFSPKSGSFRTEAYERCTATLPADFPPDACPNDATCVGAPSSGDATGCRVCLP